MALRPNRAWTLTVFRIDRVWLRFGNDGNETVFDCVPGRRSFWEQDNKISPYFSGYLTKLLLQSLARDKALAFFLFCWCFSGFYTPRRGIQQFISLLHPGFENGIWLSLFICLYRCNNSVSLGDNSYLRPKVNNLNRILLRGEPDDTTCPGITKVLKSRLRHIRTVSAAFKLIIKFHHGTVSN